MAAAPAEAGYDGIPQAGALLAVANAIGVAAAVLEPQRVGGGQLGIHGFKAARIGNQPDALLTVDAMVVPTTLADTGIGEQILAVDHQATLGTFAPEAVVLGELLGVSRHWNSLAAIGEPVEQRHQQGQQRAGGSSHILLFNDPPASQPGPAAPAKGRCPQTTPKPLPPPKRDQRPGADGAAINR